MNGDESHWPSCPLPLIDVDCEGLRGKEAVERVWFFDLASPTRLIFLAYRSSWFFEVGGGGRWGARSMDKVFKWDLLRDYLIISIEFFFFFFFLLAI